MRQALGGFYEHLGEQVRAWRHRRGLSQAALGARLDPPVTRASIANIEAGRQRVLTHTLVQLSSILATPVGDLLPDARTPAEAWRELATEVARTLRLPAARARRLADRLRESS